MLPDICDELTLNVCVRQRVRPPVKDFIRLLLRPSANRSDRWNDNLFVCRSGSSLIRPTIGMFVHRFLIHPVWLVLLFGLYVCKARACAFTQAVLRCQLCISGTQLQDIIHCYRASLVMTPSLRFQLFLTKVLLRELCKRLIESEK